MILLIKMILFIYQQIIFAKYQKSKQKKHNIKSVKSVGLLLEISSAIHSRNEAYSVEIARYKLTDRNIAPFKVSDKTVSDWEKIIDKAINELINKTQIEKIENAIQKLSKHISEEEKLANDLKSIAESVTEYIVQYFIFIVFNIPTQ